MAELYIGTSGFSYSDWVGPFYPPDLPKREWLSYYAQEFQTCELNFTYYRLPNARTLAQLAEKVPPGFRFTLKATDVLTHKREEATPEAFAAFRDALRPLIEQDKFGCVLAQFPYSFKANAENRAYLERLREELADLPVVVEFRHRGWITEATFELLERLGLGFCCVDQPRLRGLIPPIARATADVAYVRFHGRNAAKWWEHEHAWERYDYSYSIEELQEWVPKIRSLAEKAQSVYLFANNHWQGQAVNTARQLRLLLTESSE
ncbi:MAG TPA: DUF72 domain-containing protein [Caldilineae bacterium]|jgi:uncharacterized protein YecE (DUF72 family)|nr:DUF72 domain-containing protein [Caldilineae bacterium]